MTHPSSPPAPMTLPERLRAIRFSSNPDDYDAITIEAAAEIDALTARVAELERERQYTCEQHRDEVRKGERCVWCELAAARGAFDLSESERQRLAGRINATEAELAAARKVEDGEVAQMAAALRADCNCADNVDAEQQYDGTWVGSFSRCTSCKSADLLTRLSAALKEAGQRASDHLRASEILNRHCVRLEARAQAAEATIDAAQGHFEFLIAMTQLADVNGKVEVRSTGQTKFASEPLATAMAREAFAALVEIRALQTKDTTP